MTKDTITINKKWLEDVLLKQVDENTRQLKENTSILRTHSSFLKGIDNDLGVLKKNQIISPQRKIHVIYER